MPTLKDLYQAVNVAGYHKPLTAKVRGCWEENCDLYALVGDNYSLARASHALVRGCSQETRLVSVKAKDDGDYDGEALVVLNLGNEHKCRFKNLDFRSEPNSVEDTMEEGGDP
jgi:hypothetical protein